jgi:hypothetical protein
VGLGDDVDHPLPHIAVGDNGSRYLVTVTTWPSGEFLIEHACWDNVAMNWRDRIWRA